MTRLHDAVAAPLLEGPPHWTALAACAQSDPEMWFPSSGEDSTPAITICATCPVQTDCLIEALDNADDEFGIRGGLTAYERRSLRLQESATECKYCHEPLADRASARTYHVRCRLAAKAERERRPRHRPQDGPRPCRTCPTPAPPRCVYCPECREVRKEALRIADKERKAAARARLKDAS